MNQKRIFWIILLFLIVSLDVSMVRHLEHSYKGQEQESQLAQEEEALSTLRAFELPPDIYEQLVKKLKKDFKIRNNKELCENILAYLFCHSVKQSDLKQWRSLERDAQPKLYEDHTKMIENLLADAVCFPVPEAIDHKEAFVTYENSWQSERTYGGVRGHEGCDLMASVQQRGYYPIVSVSDGTVEKIGWLPQGGYRIGIRSRHGVYYYYAHLAEYEEGIAEGTKITAGQLLGYMGDTGYSEVEGTTGNFPVHLHFGMYLDLEGRGEVSFNPYYLLNILEKKKLKYMFKS